jgi:hypothetical protein
VPAKTQREREALQRKAKLDRIAEQVTEGSLVIRQMTDADRRRFGLAKGRDAQNPTAAQRRRAERARARNQRLRAAE